MKRNRHFFRSALGLAVGAVSVAAVQAEENSYTRVITGRNVFGLKSPPIIIEDPRPESPKPVIKLQGIHNILGPRKVMLKLQFLARPGTPAREICLVLDEGQSAEGIQVLAIDEKTGSVKFINHGTAQTLTLKDNSDNPVLNPGVAVASPVTPRR